jgi:hypothetical protein
MLKHVNFTIYYPHGNGQVKSTNKVIGGLLTKLVNEKKTNWDEHLSTILFSYKTFYKVVTWYTPYKFVYGLHPLIPTKYVLPAISGDHRDVKPTKILIAMIIELEKLQENRLEVLNNVGLNHWSGFLWN